MIVTPFTTEKRHYLNASIPFVLLLWSKLVRQFCRFLRDLEALRLCRTLTAPRILHKAFSLLNRIETS